MQVRARTLAAWGAVALGLGNLARVPGIPLVLADAVTLAVAGFALVAVASRRVQPRKDRVLGGAIAFALVAAVSSGVAIVRYSPGAPEALGIVAYLVRWLAYLAWYPFVAWCLTRREADDAWRYAEWAILAFGVFGIAQSAFLPGFAQMVGSGGLEWDVQGRRLVSTVLDPNFAGILLVIALLARLARVAEGVREGAVPLVVLATGVLLTLSRSALLALAVGLVTLAVTRGLRVALVKVFLAGAVLLVPFLSLLLSFAAGFNKLGIDASATQRFVPWIQGVILVRDHPWLGVGFNAITQAQQVRGWPPIGGADGALDGGLLLVAAMTGLVGLAFFVRMLLRVVGSARRVWRNAEASREDRAHASASVAALAAVLVHSLFVNSLFLPFVMQMLWTMWGRLAHMRAAVRVRSRAAAALVLVPLAMGMSACDPCAGVASCDADPDAVAVTGSVLHYLSGDPVAGVVVTGSFTAGSSAPVTVATTTDREGQWTLRTRVPGDGDVRAAFRVAPPERGDYAIPPQSVRRPATAGDAVHLGAWVDRPSIRYIVGVQFGEEPLAHAGVSFAYESGVRAAGAPAYAGTDGRGILEYVFVGDSVGTSVQTLTVVHPRRGTIRIPAVQVPLGYRWELAGFRGSLDARPGLWYGGAIVFIGTMEKVPGATFTFRRTGGVGLGEDTFVATTRADGFFEFRVPADARGEIVGDVTIAPPPGGPAAAPRVYRDVRLATVDGDRARDLGLWGYGEAWNWSVEIWRHFDLKPAPGIPVEFRQRGGPALTPSVFARTTDAAGRVEFRAAVRDTGVVVGDLVIKPPGQPEEVRELRLRTNPTPDLYFAGVFGFGPYATP